MFAHKQKFGHKQMFGLKQMFEFKQMFAHKHLFAKKDQFQEYYTQTIKMRSLIIIQVYLIFIYQYKDETTMSSNHRTRSRTHIRGQTKAQQDHMNNIISTFTSMHLRDRVIWDFVKMFVLVLLNKIRCSPKFKQMLTKSKSNVQHKH